MKENENVEQSSVKSRITDFLHFKNLSQRKFEEMTGLSNGYINSMRKSIKSSTFDEKIAPVFPELNKLWILHGEGSMLKSDDFLSNIAIKEPEPLINPTTKDVLKQLHSIQNKNKNEKSSRLINDGDLVDAVEIIVPVPGQAGLSSRMYPEEMIDEFERRIIRVKPEHRGVFYTIEADGNSMPPKIQPHDWVRCEEISSLFWFEKNFFKENKIYCIWHNTRGIIFKRIIYVDGNLICRSDNEDKKNYPDFPLELEKVNKILIARKIIDRSL